MHGQAAVRAVVQVCRDDSDFITALATSSGKLPGGSDLKVVGGDLDLGSAGEI